MFRTWQRAFAAACLQVALAPALAAAPGADWQDGFVQALDREQFDVAERIATQAMAALPAGPDWRTHEACAAAAQMAELRQSQARFREAEALLAPLMEASRPRPGKAAERHATLLLQRGRLHADQWRFPQAEADYAAAAALIKGNEARWPALHEDLLNSMSTLLATEQRQWEALQWAERLAVLCRQRYGKDSAELARTLQWIGELQDEPRRLQRRLAAFGEAGRIFQLHYASGRATAIDAHQDMVRWIENAHDFHLFDTKPDQLTARRQLIAAIENERGADSPALIEALADYAGASEEELPFGRIDAMLKRAHGIASRTLGDHPRTAQVLENIAVFYASREPGSDALRRRAEAARQQSSQMRVRVYGPGSVRMALDRVHDYFSNPPACSYSRGSCQAALRRLLEPVSQAWGAGHPAYATYLRGLATRLDNSYEGGPDGKLEELPDVGRFKLDLMAEARRGLAGALGESHVEVALVDKARADVLANFLQRYGEASDAAASALQTFRKAYGTTDEATGELRQTLIYWQTQAGRHGPALAVAEQDLPDALDPHKALPHQALRLATDLAHLRTSAGRSADADAAYRQAERLARDHAGLSAWQDLLKEMLGFYEQQGMKADAARITALMGCAARHKGPNVPAACR